MATLGPSVPGLKDEYRRIPRQRCTTRRKKTLARKLRRLYRPYFKFEVAPPEHRLIPYYDSDVEGMHR